jgi:predicted phage tail protein
MMQVTCRNKITGSETRKTTYDRKNDGVEVTYRDNVTGNSETVYVPADRSALNPERITFEGCTTVQQATKLAYRLYNKQQYQTETVRFDVDDFGRNIVPGARIDSPDSTRFTKRADVTDGYRVYDGEVVNVQGFEVTLSEPVYFTPGEDHYITFTKEDGSNSESIQCSQVDDYRILLETLPSEPIYDGYSRDRTKYLLVSEQLKESVALIPRTIEYSLSDAGFEVHTINCVNYTDKYYQNDND